MIFWIEINSFWEEVILFLTFQHWCKNLKPLEINQRGTNAYFVSGKKWLYRKYFLPQNPTEINGTAQVEYGGQVVLQVVFLGHQNVPLNYF